MLRRRALHGQFFDTAHCSLGRRAELVGQAGPNGVPYCVGAQADGV